MQSLQYVLKPIKNFVIFSCWRYCWFECSIPTTKITIWSCYILCIASTFNHLYTLKYFQLRFFEIMLFTSQETMTIVEVDLGTSTNECLICVFICKYMYRAAANACVCLRVRRCSTCWSEARTWRRRTARACARSTAPSAPATTASSCASSEKAPS